VTLTDRLHFQNSINEINQRQQAQLEAIIVGFREISSRVDASIQQAEIDRSTFIERISKIAEGLEDVQEQAAADRQQAAIDRQAFQQEIRHVWEYLMGQ
jgi:septal ring factor EnvC (AmiA/AmiB activator)